MMKKAFILGLSLSLALTMTACGNTAAEGSNSGSQDTSTPEVTQPVDTSTPEVEQTVEGDGLLAEDTDTTTGTESTSHSDIELYELIYESAAAMDPDFTDEMAFDMEKSLAEAYSGASASGEAFYDGYITWRLENHPLQTTDPAPDTTPSNGGTSNGNTSGGNTSGSSGGTNTTKPTTNTGNSGSTTGNSGDTGGSGGAWLPDGATTSGPSEFYVPNEGLTEEEIAQKDKEFEEWLENTDIIFNAG